MKLLPILVLCCMTVPLMAQTILWEKTPLPQGDILDIAVRKNGDVIAVSARPSGGVYRSTDLGMTWDSINGNLVNRQASRVAIDSAGNIIIGIGGGGIYAGVFRTTDNGITWIALNSGWPFDGTNYAEPRSVASDSTGVLFGASAQSSQEGAYRFIPAGSGWTAINTGLTGLSTPRVQDPTRFLFAAPYTFLGSNGDGIFRTTDKGTSWSAARTGLATDSVFTIAADSGGYLYAGLGGRGGISRSTDDGGSWADASIGLPRSATVEALATDSRGWIFAGTSRAGMYYSNRRGVSWDDANAGLTDSNIRSAATSGRIAFAGTPSGVFRTRCSGGSLSVFVQTPVPVCPLEVASLAVRTLNGTPPFRYRWSPTVGLSDSTTPTPDARVSSTTTFHVSVSDINGDCGSDSVTVTIVPSPAAAIVPADSATYCAGTVLNLFARPDTGMTYSWLLNGSLISGAGQAVYPVLQAGSYQVVATNAAGCSDTSRPTVVRAGNVPHAGVTVLGDTAFCRGTNVTLVADPVVGASYQWTKNGLPIDTATTERFVADAGGTYRVVVTIGTGCRDSSRSVDVTIWPTPTAAASGPSSVCQNADVMYFVTPHAGSSVEWFVTNGIVSTRRDVDSIHVAWGLAGTGTIRCVLTDQTSGCTDDTTIAVTILSALRPVIMVSGPTTICEGDSVLLDAGPGFVSYIWSTGERSEHIAARLPGVYSVSVIDSNGCSGSAVPVYINVNPRPMFTINANGPLTFCEGDSVILEVPAGFARYEWSTGDTTRSIVVKTGNVYVARVFNAIGCAAERFVVVTVKPKPMVTIQGKLEICEGDYTSLEGGPSSGSYLWSTGETGTIITVHTPGRYSLRVTNQSGCTDSAVVNVIVHPERNNFISGSRLLCAGGTTSLSGPPGAIAYRWSTGDTTQTISISTPGQYSLQLHDRAECWWQDKVTIVQLPPLQPEIIGSLTFCKGGSTVLSTKDAYIRYIWSTGDTTRSAFINQQGPVSVRVTDAYGCTGVAVVTALEGPGLTPIITGPRTLCPGGKVTLDGGAGYRTYQWSTGDTTRTIDVRATGEYHLDVRDAYGCEGHANATVVEGSNLTVAITGPTGICPGSTAPLDAGEMYASYRWSTGDTTHAIIVSGPGTYAVSVTDSNGCTGSGVFTLKEHRRLDSLIRRSYTLCRGGTVLLNAANPAFTFYRWSTGDISPSVIARYPGTYRLTVQDTNNCRWDVQIRVTEVDPPHPSISGARTFCAGDSTVLDAGADFALYEWSNGATTRTVSITKPGVYTVRVTDANGCRGSDSVTVSVYPTPSLTLSGGSVFCEGDSTELDAGGGFASYLWSTGATSRTIIVTREGLYHVRAIDGNGCTARDTVHVSMRPAPHPVLPGEFVICEGDTITVDAGEYSDYLWNTGATTRTIRVSTSGRYRVTVRNSAGCSGTAESVVTVNPRPPAPVITRQGDTLTATPGVAYQWYRNGSMVQDATGRVLLPGRPGVFTVEIADRNGCKAMSQPFEFGGNSAIRLTLRNGAAGPIEAGKSIVLPIVISEALGLSPDSPQDLRVQIRFNRTLLSPRGTVLESRTEGHDRIITVEGKRSATQTDGPVIQEPFIVLLGDSACTQVRIDSAWWTDGNIRTIVTDTPCVICAAICRNGGSRLFFETGTLGLAQNTPNPFNASTRIEYEIIESGRTELVVYNALGRSIATLVDDVMHAGRYAVFFDASSLPSGVYYYVLRTPSQILSRQMVLAK